MKWEQWKSWEHISHWFEWKRDENEVREMKEQGGGIYRPMSRTTSSLKWHTSYSSNTSCYSSDTLSSILHVHSRTRFTQVIYTPYYSSNAESLTWVIHGYLTRVTLKCLLEQPISQSFTINSILVSIKIEMRPNGRLQRTLPKSDWAITFV